jgi:hypothetical protein
MTRVAKGLPIMFWFQLALMVILLGAVVALAYFSLQTHSALCAFKGDLERRAENNREIIEKHQGPIIHVFGLQIPRGELEQSLANQERTLNSLRQLKCERSLP